MSAIAVSTEDKLTWRHIGLAFTAACMSFFCVALMFNAAGVFYSYVSTEFGVGLGKITLYITLSYIGAMVLLPIGGGLMDKIEALEKSGDIIVVRPADVKGVGRLEKSPAKLTALYNHGYEVAKEMFG